MAKFSPDIRRKQASNRHAHTRFVRQEAVIVARTNTFTFAFHVRPALDIRPTLARHRGFADIVYAGDKHLVAAIDILDAATGDLGATVLIARIVASTRASADLLHSRRRTIARPANNRFASADASRLRFTHPVVETDFTSQRSSNA